MARARHEEQAAPIADRLRAAIVGNELAVITRGVLRREPRIADAVIEDQLAAARGERVETRPLGGVAEIRNRVGGIRGLA